MRTTRRALLVLSSASALACSGTGGTPGADTVATAAAPMADVSAVRRTIDSLNQVAMAGFGTKDVAAMTANYTDAALIMMPGMPTVTGRTAWAQMAQGMFESMDIANMRFETTDLQLAGDLAVETGRYWMSVGPKGGPVAPDSGKYLTVWQRQAGGDWKIIRDINNTDIAPKP